MMNKKYAALAALLALSIMTGTVITGCGDSGSIPVSSAAGSAAGLDGAAADEEDGKTDAPLPDEKPKNVVAEGELPSQSLTDTDDSKGSAGVSGAGQSLQPSHGNSHSSSDTDTDDSYFDGAVFIGDSLTEGFQLHGGITNAAYYGFKNLNIKEVFEKALVKSGSGKITIADALKKNNFDKYYIMLGANELGWVYPEVFIKKYGDLIDLIKTDNPDAKIYIQSILPVTAEASEKSTVYSNSRIDYYNGLIANLAADKNVTYLNVREAVQNENGILPDDAATDGVHLNKDYCRKWADYLRQNH